MNKTKPPPDHAGKIAKPGRAVSYLWKPAFFCALLFLCSVAAISFHHHHDGCTHDDCPICVAAFVICTAAIGVRFFVRALYMAVSRREAFEAASVYDFPGPYLPRTRAPPVFLPV